MTPHAHAGPMPIRRWRAPTRAFALALLLLLSASPFAARADDASIDAAPALDRSGFAAFARGDEVHILGGFVPGRGRTDDILVYDAAARTFSLSASRLPLPVSQAHAAWDPRPREGCPDGCAYVFGGFDLATGQNLVIEYAPATGAASVVAQYWTGGHARRVSNAVWTGEEVVLVGGSGCGSSGSCAEILRYDPLQRAVSTAPLPAARQGMAAAWGGDAVYAFGGFRCEDPLPGGGACDEILRFDPATGALSVLDARLPFPAHEGAAYWDGHRVFVAGGYDAASGERDHVVRFDPANGSVVEMRARLPVPFGEGRAAWMGDHALLLTAGHAPLRHHLRPAAPSGASAAPSTSGVATVLAWTPPAEDTYSVLTHHRVYRVSPLTGEETLLATLPAGATSFVDEGRAFGTASYRISAVNAARDEGPSAPASAVPLPARVLP